MDPVKDHELYQGLESALGVTVATGLMERLPPPPVDRLATKDDVAGLRADADERFEQVDKRFEQVDKRFDRIEAGIDGIRVAAAERSEKVDRRFTDLEVAIVALNGKVDRVHQEFLAVLRGEVIGVMNAQGRHLVFALIGSLVGICTLAFLLSQLAG